MPFPVPPVSLGLEAITGLVCHCPEEFTEIDIPPIHHESRYFSIYTCQTLMVYLFQFNFSPPNVLCGLLRFLLLQQPTATTWSLHHLSRPLVCFRSLEVFAYIKFCPINVCVVWFLPNILQTLYWNIVSMLLIFVAKQHHQNFINGKNLQMCNSILRVCLLIFEWFLFGDVKYEGLSISNASCH